MASDIDRITKNTTKLSNVHGKGLTLWSDDREETNQIVKINVSLKTFTSAVYVYLPIHPRVSDLTALFTLLVKLNEPEKCSAKP